MDISSFVKIFYLLTSLKDVVSLVWDIGCGTTKGCFPDCNGGYSYLVTWQDTGTDIRFTLLAEESDTSVYLAVGFSNDYLMGDDSVVMCMLPTSGVYSYYNEDTNSHALSPNNTGLSAVSLNHNAGIINCSFTRAYSAADPKFFDLKNDYILMLVVGEVKNKHGADEASKHYVIPWSSNSKVDFNRHYCVGEYKLNGPVVKLHGIMMTLAWLFFCVIGLLTARYNKDMLPDKKLFGTKVWFQVHRASMMSVLGFVVAGFIAIFVHIGGYSQVPPRKNISGGDSHPVLGIIVTGLCLINPVMALFRPNPDHKFRWIFNWAHFGVGVIAQGLAVVTVILGLLLERANVPRSALWVTVAHILVTAIASGALEVHRRIAESAKQRIFFMTKKNYGTVSTASLNLPMDQNPKDAGTKDDDKSNVPFISLIVCTLSSAAFSLAVLVIIAVS